MLVTPLSPLSWDCYEVGDFLHVAGVSFENSLSGKDFFSNLNGCTDLSEVDKQKILALLDKMRKN